MKALTIIFSCLSCLLYGQTDINSILKDVQELRTPYSPENENDKIKILVGNDSTYILMKLIEKQPTTINEIVSSAFGKFDCNEDEACIDVAELKKIGLNGYIKIDSNNYLIHLTLLPKSLFSSSIGILVSMNISGELNDWFFVKRSISGNPNGQLSRNFKIDKTFNITVSESSWGRNNFNYYLEAVYKVFSSANREGNRNNEGKNDDEEEDYDYDNSLEIKAYYYDLIEGKFELTKLCLDI